MLKYTKYALALPIFPIVIVAATIGFAVITTCLGTYGSVVWLAKEIAK